MTETELKNIIAKNLADNRKLLNFTQLELAEKLNYSDKSISKWERGEAIPDVYVLKQLSDLFGTTVDSLMTDRSKNKSVSLLGLTFKKRILIPILSVLLVFFIATIVSCCLMVFVPEFAYAWMAFIIALPVSSIVAIVFSAIWGNRIAVSICVSALTWTSALLIFLLVNKPNIYLFFVIAAVFQLLIVGWHFLFSSKPKNRK